MTEAVERAAGDDTPQAGTVREGEGFAGEPAGEAAGPADEVVDNEGDRAAQTGGRAGAARHPHPTSRRARAAARRAGGGVGRGAPAWLGLSWRRLLEPAAPVTSENLQRRRSVTVAAIAVVAAAGVGLSLWGTAIVRGSTAGEYVEPAIAPAEPGYQAFVVATPTLAVLQPDDDGDLASAALLSLRSGDDGGAVTLVPVTALVPDRKADDETTTTTASTDSTGSTESTGSGRETSTTSASGATGTSADAGSSGDRSTDTTDAAGTTDPADTADTSDTGDTETTQPDVAGSTVAEAYEDGGVDAALQAMGEVLGVAVDDGVEVDAATWADLVEPVSPVTFTLDDAVGVWPSGQVSLPAEQVGAFLAYGGDDESDDARADRQAEFWSAWLQQVGDAGEAAVPADAEGDLARFLTGIARGPSAEVLPVVESDAGGGTVEPDPGPASELIARAVPYPLSPAPGARVRVRLLNGTRESRLTAEVVPDLVAAGAEITIAGNATSFDVTETTYTYDDPTNQADAERFAEALGVGKVVEGKQVSVTSSPSGSATTLASADDPEDHIDLTIVLGSDVRDLIRRLESTG